LFLKGGVSLLKAYNTYLDMKLIDIFDIRNFEKRKY